MAASASATSVSIPLTGKVGTGGAAVIAAEPVGREMDIWLDAGAAATSARLPMAARAAMTFVETKVEVIIWMRMV